MTIGKATITIKERQADLSKLIENAAKKHLKSIGTKVSNAIGKEVKQIVYKAIYNCEELKDLRSGLLRGELGLTKSQATNASTSIAEAVSNSIFVEAERGSGRNAGKVLLKIQPTDYNNVLSETAYSSIYSYSRKKKRARKSEIAWLRWLLFRGDAVIVKGFTFVAESGEGRSGLGDMERGGSWRIDPAYSGTKNDNFITRALQRGSASEKIVKIIERIFKQNW
tara:strand:+ start:809 stop:1480 length:672 start_codon:yes stop_codon:yes gene_type:complete